MSYGCEVLADSISNAGVRLTTLQVTFPRIVLAEFNTHRMFSRNSASSRAIPVEKRCQSVWERPFVPEAFLANKKGMQAGDLLDAVEAEHAAQSWREACDDAIRHAEALAEIGVHKQWANRLLEPFSWHTVIVTATEWANFFAQRCSPNAQPEIRTIAEMMRDSLAEHTPVLLDDGEWHLPLIMEEDWAEGWPTASEAGNETAAKVSAARCARVSYLTHAGWRDPSEDLALYDRLVSQGHMSPLEHAARPATEEDCFNRCCDLVGGPPTDHDDHGTDKVPHASHLFFGNLRGWVSLRKTIPGEDIYKEA